MEIKEVINSMSLAIINGDNAKERGDVDAFEEARSSWDDLEKLLDEMIKEEERRLSSIF